MWCSSRNEQQEALLLQPLRAAVFPETRTSGLRTHPAAVTSVSLEEAEKKRVSVQTVQKRKQEGRRVLNGFLSEFGAVQSLERADQSVRKV